MGMKIKRRVFSRIFVGETWEYLEDAQGREVSVGDRVATFTTSPVSGTILGFKAEPRLFFDQTWELFIARGGNLNDVTRVEISNTALIVLEEEGECLNDPS